MTTRIDIVVPDLGIVSAGNTVTADRYLKMVSGLGYEARITDTPDAPVVVALNAYRSSGTITTLADDCTAIVVLTGTDIYRFWDSERPSVEAALDRSNVIVGLNSLAGLRLPSSMQSRLVIIKEGARRPAVPWGGAVETGPLRVVMVGHIRPEKGTGVVARALRQLPDDSTVQLDHYGAAHSAEWAKWAEHETANNARYRWHGEVSRDRLDAVYSEASVLVNASRHEGGANVISEAAMVGTPILASAIDGNVGVLGEAHPGLFADGDPDALAGELAELDTNRALLNRLASASVDLQLDLSEEEEARRWSRVLIDAIN